MPSRWDSRPFHVIYLAVAVGLLPGVGFRLLDASLGAGVILDLVLLVLNEPPFPRFRHVGGRFVVSLSVG